MIHWRKAFVAALVLPAVGGTAAAATYEFGGHEYQVVTASDITWDAARAAAQSAGWDLATIGSVEENDFLESLLGASGNNRAHYWLGATDTGTEGTWVWIDGTPWSFTDWGSGEPNNSGDEDYLAFDARASWVWNDAPANVMTSYNFDGGYIMERSLDAAVPVPAALPLFLSGLAGLGFFSQRRKKPAMA
jgi:hypothetical protein